MINNNSIKREENEIKYYNITFSTSFVYIQNILYDANGKMHLFRGHFGVKIVSGTKNVIYKYQKRYKIKIMYHLFAKVKDHVSFMYFILLFKIKTNIHNE